MCRCKFKCQNITLADKQKAFKDFYKISYNNQTSLLALQCIDIVNIAKENISRSHCSKKYYLPILNQETSKVQVCPKALCYVLRITPRRLQKLQKS